MKKDEQEKEGTLSRRAFAFGVLPAVAVAGTTTAWAKDVPGATSPHHGTFPGMITRQREPINLEFPFPTLDSLITPTNRFYIRNHFSVPHLDPVTWRLNVGGAVRHPLFLSYDELRKLPSKTLMATLECAGNSRVLLVPTAKGAQCEQGGVSNAQWTGVPLAALLERAGVDTNAVEVILEGADKGELKEEPKSPGVIHFARSLPLAKALHGDVLIATHMNGQELTPEHGFPVRAIVPGWYGMASVKWLTHITLTATPFDGYWQTLEYAYFRRNHGLSDLVPITEMQVKAEIARPMLHEVVPAALPYRIFGATWTGESEVARVEVSSDGGKTWHDAKLLGKATSFSWRLWEYQWPVPSKRGRAVLMARATDKRGYRQPSHHDPDRRNYMINFVQPIEVEIQ